MLRYVIMYLYKKKNGKKFDLKIARYRGLPYSGWTCQSETTLLSWLNSPLRISRMRDPSWRDHIFPVGTGPRSNIRRPNSILSSWSQQLSHKCRARRNATNSESDTHAHVYNSISFSPPRILK